MIRPSEIMRAYWTHPPLMDVFHFCRGQCNLQSHHIHSASPEKGTGFLLSRIRTSFCQNKFILTETWMRFSTFSDFASKCIMSSEFPPGPVRHCLTLGLPEKLESCLDIRDIIARAIRPLKPRQLPDESMPRFKIRGMVG